MPIAWAVSLLLHAGGLVAVGVSWQASGQADPLDASLPRPEAEDTPLGIEESQAVTLTWLGFQNPTPHEADRARVEQPQLSLAPPAVDAEQQPEPPLEPAEEQAQPDQPVDPTPPRPAAQPLDPAAVLPLIPEQAPPAAGFEARSVVPSDVELIMGPPDPPRPPTAEQGQPEAQPEAKPSTPAEAAPAASSPAPTPSQPAPQVGDRPGLPSEQQASATALEETLRIRPGQTVARQGLTIRTRDPRISLPDEFTFVGRNPIVILDFKRDGRIRHPITWVRRSGMASVDHDVEIAVYAWTATGAMLEALPPDPSPERPSTLSVRMEIVLWR